MKRSRSVVPRCTSKRQRTDEGEGGEGAKALLSLIVNINGTHRIYYVERRQLGSPDVGTVPVWGLRNAIWNDFLREDERYPLLKIARLCIFIGGKRVCDRETTILHPRSPIIATIAYTDSVHG